MRGTDARRETRAPSLRRRGAEEGYTSREAAQLSGVPFFTVDSWDRSGFLRPSISRGTGRGKGRERTYGHADVLRLRIARALRDQRVSLQTLRSLLAKLERVGRALESSRYVVVHDEAICVGSQRDLTRVLTRPRSHALSLFLDMREIVAFVEAQARVLRAERRRHAQLIGSSKEAARRTRG